MPATSESVHHLQSRQIFRRAICQSLACCVLLAFATQRRSQAQAVDHPAQISRQPQLEPASTPSPEAVTDGQASQPASNMAPIHIVPFGPPAKPNTNHPKPIGQSSNNGQVQYFGGPVISNVQVVEVLWGNFVDTPSTTGLEQFFTDITQSSYFGLLAEYSTVGLTGLGGAPGSNQTIGPGTFLSPRITITPSVCPGSAANLPCTITDAQIQSEIINQFNAHHLPTPTQDGHGNFNTIYMVYFPPGVTIVLQPGVNSCQNHGFCAYHSTVNQGVAPNLLYGVFPDFGPTSGCSASGHGCGFGTSQQNLSSASSHELGEAVTDAQVGLFNSSVASPPLAWVDQNSGAEIGDFCNQNEHQVTVNSNTYTVQALFSNMQGQCVIAPSHFQLQPLTNSAVPGVPFPVTVAAVSSTGFQLTNYNNTVHFTSSDGSAVLPADYAFLPSTDNGRHTFNVTLSTTGMQTITTNDTVILLMTGSTSVDIEHNPDMMTVLSHTGNFRQGDVGDTYTITMTNVGDLPTNGSQVGVVMGGNGTLPAGLTATAMTGSGWNCIVATLACTRTDVLAAKTAYPLITLTVNVANNAPASVTPVAQGGGGGEVNSSNNNSFDPTTIIPMPDLAISKSHLGSFAQGQVGANYTLTVTNVGGGATSGTVSVSDTLPTGLTATAISGNGWTCSTPPTLTCTRADALAGGGAGYPPITLTVNVDPAAPMPTVTNVATVSGGGEVNLGNDTANDITTITAAAPDLTVASAHTGNFTQGQSGSYSLTASNIGPLPTTGTVTVTDNLPLGLAATSMGGTGWTCNISTVSCTRSDALPGNTGTVSSYPPITLGVSVSTSAPLSVTNVVTVSGGGELNTANDTAFDPTTIIGAPDLALFSNHLGDFVAGQTGVYSLTVNNFGQGPSTGNVTVVEMPPSGFTVTAMTGPGWSCTVSTVTCTRGDSVVPNATFPAISVTVSLASTLSEGIVTNMATVSGGGDVNPSNDTAFDQTEVLVPLSFPGATTSVTVVPGQSANYGILVSAGALGTITFGCNGLPAGAACHIPASPLVVTEPALLNVFLTVSTTAPPASRFSRAAAKTEPPLPFHSAVLFLVGIGGIILAGPCCKRGGIRRTARVSGVAILLLIMGCGGGGSTPPPPPVPQGTPAGNYSITVTATNGNLQASKTIFLVVQ